MAGNNFDSNHFAMLAKTMKKRNELRDRERLNQLEQENQQQSVTIHTLLGIREIELLLPEFNPSRNPDTYATEWLRQVELLGKIHKWEPEHLMLYATMRLSGIAKMWYHYSLDSISDWEDFKQRLVSNFPRTVDAADIHAKLMAKKRRHDETLEEYFHSTLALAKKIKLNDDAVRDYLIQGLTQTRHQVVLSSIGHCSLTEFLQHLLHLERDSNEAKSIIETSQRIQSRHVERNTFQNVSHAPQPGSSRQLISSPQSLSKRPLSSATIEKNQPNPPKKRRACFICKSEDHMVVECPDNPIKNDQRDQPTAIKKAPEEEKEDKEMKVYLEKLEDLKKRNWVVKLQLGDLNILRSRKNLDGVANKTDKMSTTGYQLVNEKVYFNTPDGLRFYVPRGIRFLIMKGYHDVKHLDYNSTLKIIKRIYWFPRMSKDLQKFINSCNMCLRRSQTPYATLEKIKFPYYAVYVDFYGAYGKTTAQNEFVMLLLDRFSQFVILKAVKAPTPIITTKILDLYAQHFPVPSAVNTKKQRVFASEEFQKYCEVNGIQHIVQKANNETTAIDKRLQSVKDVLKSHCENEAADWDEKLPKVQEMLNNMKVYNHTENSENPNDGLFNYSPLDDLCERLHNAIAEDLKHLKPFKDEMKIEDVENIEGIEEIIGDADSTGVTYNLNETVLVRDSTSEKTEKSEDPANPRYRGPYVIRKVLEDNRYTVSDTYTTQVTKERFAKMYLAKDLKKWPTKEDMDLFLKLNIDDNDKTEEVAKE